MVAMWCCNTIGVKECFARVVHLPSKAAVLHAQWTKHGGCQIGMQWELGDVFYDALEILKAFARIAEECTGRGLGNERALTDFLAPIGEAGRMTQDLARRNQPCLRVTNQRIRRDV